MTLSIQSSTSALRLIRALSSAQSSQDTSLLRISTGLRINSPADDPAGSWVASRFRSQLSSISQASENSQLANSQLSTADAALEQIRGLLDTISASVIAVQAGGADVAAEQSTVDEAIQSINRLTLSASFGSTSLLNGTTAIPVTSKSSALSDVDPRRVDFNGAATYTFAVNVTAAGTQAQLNVADPAQVAVNGAGTATIRLTGPLGTADITLNAGDTGATLATAVNGVRDQTGLYYDNALGQILSEKFGSTVTLSTEQVAGTAVFEDGLGGNIAAYRSDAGTDTAGTVNGVTFGANGNQITSSSGPFSLKFNFRPGNGAGAYTITVAKGGLPLQLGTRTLPSDQLNLGINTTLASVLGTTSETIGGQTVGGFLSSVLGGGANDLFTRPTNAASIVESAQNQIDSLRTFLGSIISSSIEPNINYLADASLNLTDSLRIVQGADIAEESSTLALAQARVDASTSSLIISNDFSRSVASKLLAALEPK